MCGICGIISLGEEKSIDKNTLLRMNRVLIHRGPDDEGVLIKKDVGLAMRRLSVIDIVGGAQPVHNEDRTIWLVFNGEIYNFRTLRVELEKQGHKFETDGDTETIVHLYEEYHEACLEKINGMFAFALWDSRRKKLFLARDRLGIKPLYYSVKNGKILFASEIKSLLQSDDVSNDLNLKALDHYLTFLSIPAPDSILKDVHKLLAGHFLVVEKGVVRINRYWKKNPGIIDNNTTVQSEGSYVERVRDLLRDSVKLRLVSDVPVGAFLSGGIDSGTTVGLMSRVSGNTVKTFSIGFEEEEADELEYARVIAEHFGTEHHEFVVKPDIVELLDDLVWYFDEPFAISSALPTYLLAKHSRSHVTVALTGDGADELFAGYPRYLWDKTAESYGLVPMAIRRGMVLPFIGLLPSSTGAGLGNTIRRAKKYLQLGALAGPRRYLGYLSFFDHEEKKRLYSRDMKRALGKVDPIEVYKPYLDEVSENDTLAQRLYLDMKTSLVDEMLMKVDRMTMAASLEARTPFLDYRLVEFVMDIPSRFKLRGTNLKYILKSAVSDLLPKKIIARKKHGFHVPLDRWMRTTLKAYCREMLSESHMKSHGLFRHAYVKDLLDRHLAGKDNFGHHLWGLIVFNLWYEKMLA